MTRRVAILAVGDELLLGDVVNSNAAWLGRQCADAGLEVVASAAVGDDPTLIVQALDVLLAEVDAVLCTGGLGPTSDDRTREALAAWSGSPLIRDEAQAARLDAWYAGRGRVPTEAVYAQAERPAVAQALANEVGSAPGLWVERAGAVVCALPGPPRELQPMATEHVLPRLRASAGWPPPLLTRQLRVAIVPESTVAEALAPIEARLPADVRLSYLAAPGEVRVRLLGVDREAVDAVADEARSLLGDAVHAEGERLLGESVVESLRERGSSVAVAESLTGGALCSALVDVPGASAVLRGSVTAYATELKADLLGVDPDLLARVGAVHPEVAAAMAAGARVRLGAVWGVATTGVAGPDPQDGHPPGTVHVAAAGPEGIRVRSLVVRGARPLVRQLAVMHALEVLRRAVLGLPESPALGRPGPTG